MNTRKTVTIHQLYGADINVSGSGMTTMTISAEKHKVVLKLGISDVEYLAQALWKSVNKVSAMAHAAENALRGGGQ